MHLIKVSGDLSNNLHVYRDICSVPVNISPLVNLNIIVTNETIVNISLALSMDFQGSTNLIVGYGICPNRTTFMMSSNMSGMANEMVQIPLFEIESDEVYCASIFFNQEGLVFHVLGGFSSSKL